MCKANIVICFQLNIKGDTFASIEEEEIGCLL